MRILSLILMILSQSAFGAAGGGAVAFSEETKALIKEGKLTLAAQAGNINAVRVLLKKGANLNLDLVNKEGKTPWMLAIENGHVEIASLLQVEDAELIAIEEEAEKGKCIYSIERVTTTEDGSTSCVIKYSNGDVYTGQMGERGPHGEGDLWNQSARKEEFGIWFNGCKSGLFLVRLYETDRDSPVVSCYKEGYLNGRCVSSDKGIDPSSSDEVLDAPLLLGLPGKTDQ
jgi:hypothetical protein